MHFLGRSSASSGRRPRVNQETEEALTDVCVPVADIHQAAIFRGNAGLECLGDVGKIRARRKAVWDFTVLEVTPNPRPASFQTDYTGSDPAYNKTE